MLIDSTKMYQIFSGKGGVVGVSGTKGEKGQQGPTTGKIPKKGLPGLPGFTHNAQPRGRCINIEHFYETVCLLSKMCLYKAL